MLMRAAVIYARVSTPRQGREVLEDLKTFCRRINARLEDATFEEK
jgi:DNA invertase Pin-like site-specific DNA recombinase